MLAVAGGKGGCGKTTTALGVAAALAAVGERSERSVLVADADRDMPDLHTLAGVDRTPTLEDAVNADAPGAVARSTEDVHAPGVRILPAPTGITGDVTVALSTLSDDVAVVDCPAGAGPDAVAPLRIAGRVLLVAQATGESLRDAVKTATMARELDCRPVGLVLTRTDRVPDAVRAALDVPDAWTVPPASGAPLDDDAVRTAYRQVVRDVSSVGSRAHDTAPVGK